MDTVISSSFRFILTPESSPKISLLVATVEVDYVHDGIQIKIFDAVEPFLHEWITSLADGKKEKLVFQSLDGTGICLYQLHFDDCQIIDHTLEYDYDYQKTTQAIHTVYLAYSKMRRLQKSQLPN
jgi:hypothetical protein